MGHETGPTKKYPFWKEAVGEEIKGTLDRYRHHRSSPEKLAEELYFDLMLIATTPTEFDARIYARALRSIGLGELVRRAKRGRYSHHDSTQALEQAIRAYIPRIRW